MMAACLYQKMLFSGQISGEEDLAVEKEMSLARISDLERQVQELRCLVSFVCFPVTVYGGLYTNYYMFF